MIRKPLSPVLAALLGILVLAGCSQPPSASAPVPATDAAEAAPAQAAGGDEAFGFRIGPLQAFALRDGDIELPNDGSVFGVGQPVDEVAALLSAAGLQGEALHLAIQPLLVRDGDRVLLFDTGAGDASFARAGRLPQALRQAGVEPAQVTDIFISHAHPDHVGGLLGEDGAPAFANATLHVSAPEWAAWRRQPEAAALVAAIAPKVAEFEPGAAIIPGKVTAVPVAGHSPGHSAYDIASGDAHLLYVGDSVHHHVVSVQRPDWTIRFDGDAPVAGASRRALLQRAADQHLRVYAVHFPFPGLGRFEAGADGGFAWVPER